MYAMGLRLWKRLHSRVAGIDRPTGLEYHPGYGDMDLQAVCWLIYEPGRSSDPPPS